VRTGTSLYIPLEKIGLVNFVKVTSFFDRGERFFDNGELVKEHEKTMFWGRLSKGDETLKPNLIIIKNKINDFQH